MRKYILPLALTGLTVGLLSSAGCTTESYCFDCEPGDLPFGDAGVEASGGSGGTGMLDATGDNLFLDSNDCEADLDNDPLNCGTCGNVCEIPNAFPLCKDKFCVIDRCASGFYDINGEVADGCEYECEPLRDTEGNPLPEETLCNDVDDDCDGLIDEVFDTTSDTQHCGGCNAPCTPPANATMTCIGGVCAFDKCFDGYEDVNGDIGEVPTDGCECNSLGIELCNYNDDDCDGETDEGFDLTSDADNCGACQYACGNIYPNASTVCEDSVCSFGGCLPGFHDIDGLLATGCEYACTPQNPPAEVCNGLDDDCNGFVDDGVLPGVGTDCGSSVGACELGTQQCVAGALVCVGDVKAKIEICDGEDNDCNAETDEVCPVATSPVRLDVGGSAIGQHSTTQLSVAGQGEATYAAYLDRRTSATTNADIRLNYIATATGTWLGTDLVVAGAAASEVEPWLFTSPTGVYVAYGLFGAGSVRRIQLARTGIVPTTWTTVQAEKSAAAGADSFYVRGVVAGQAAGADQIVLVWQTLNGLNRDIYLQASSDGGATWLASDLRVNSVVGKAELPSLAADGQGRAFVAWRDARNAVPEAYVAVYDVTAGTLGGNQKLSSGDATKPPVVAADGQGNVHVTWTQLPSVGAKTVRVASSVNSGGTFGAGVVVNTPAFADADTPHVVARAGRAVVAWEDNRSGLSDIYVNVWSSGAWRVSASRADGGSRGAYSSMRPRVAFGSGNRLYVTYQEYRGTGANTQADVHVNFSVDGGLTFQPNDTRVDPGTAGVADSTSPFLTVPGDPIVVWLDNFNGMTASQNSDVYAVRLEFP
jgi:hypothetical protein